MECVVYRVTVAQGQQLHQLRPVKWFSKATLDHVALRLSKRNFAVCLSLIMKYVPRQIPAQDGKALTRG